MLLVIYGLCNIFITNLSSGTASLKLDTETTWVKVLNPSNTTNSSNTTKDSHCNEMHFEKIQ